MFVPDKSCMEGSIKTYYLTVPFDFERYLTPRSTEQLSSSHLNQKQDTREGISHYRSMPTSTELINDYSALTKKIVNSQSLEEFSQLMTIHEQKLSQDQFYPFIYKKSS